MLGKSKYYYLLSYHFYWTTRALVIAVAFSACGKKTCNPGSYIYEDQRVYKCFAEHAPSTATKKRLIFECKKENFFPLIVTQVGKYSSSSQSVSETFTCLDSEGNIELIRHPYGNSLYCTPEIARIRVWRMRAGLHHFYRGESAGSEFSSKRCTWRESLLNQN